MFSEYKGDFIGLYNNKNHLVYRWDDPDCKILFSVTRQGDAACCNFASDKRGLRRLRVAIDDFLDFVFTNFTWCIMILADVKLRSVKRLVKKLGFEICAKSKEFDYYCLTKEVYYG
jgi:hypothetical protein